MSKAEFRCLTVSAGNGRRYLDQEMGKHRRSYLVSVHSDATNETRRFRFHASVADEEAGKQGLSPDELLWALYCFLTDAMAGEDSFSDFCGDFGYDDDSRAADRTYLACREATRKVRQLFHAEPDIAGMVNELSEMGVG